jgi:3-hydroxyisobutyrate dehydrogenase-like beta-hydroxyacid dehydrogenase
MPTRTVGVVGAGHIGGLLADELLAADCEVVAYDVEADRVAELVERGAAAADSAAAVAARADAVFLALPGAPEVERVVLDDGLLDALDAGDLLVDASTTGPEAATAVAGACEERDVTFLSAPVTRGGPGPDDGMHAMVGGDPDAHEAATDLLDAVTVDHVRVGDHGAAQRFKLLLQLLYAGRAAVDAEVVAAARDQDLPADVLNDVLELDVSERLLSGNFSSPRAGMGGLAIWHKDLGYLQSVTADRDTALPLGSAVHEAYRHAMRVRDPDEKDAAAVVRHWERLNGGD